MSLRQLNIRKVLVSGGSLDHRVDPQVLNEGGGEKVAILALDEAGRVRNSWVQYIEKYQKLSGDKLRSFC